MENLYKIWLKVPVAFRNKYFFVGVAFVLWMTFFDHNNIINQLQTRNELRSLNGKRNFFKSEIETINKTKDALFNNKTELEKFAREKYLMKKEGESVFVILDEENKSVEK